ncbi:hypothetical protein PSACC_02498 [Paramicrosporidium saccamoebae]|uniref:Uncharacterized protein n=1 Tax=Paramicrosporidium saccamoebae TaxID=1246581 RepID=A0A2H9TIW5_9FUNG|nr:hypothetical protein PSACC_02498 [Paramicrosporidium saccamoebae]
MSAAMSFISIVPPNERQGQWNPVWLMVPYVVLLAVLKYRAAHHRKIQKWRKLDSGTGIAGKFWMYLREIFHCEAKVPLISSPLVVELWNAFYCSIVWILFPKQVVLVYMWIRVLFILAQVVMTLGSSHPFGEAENFVYNGKRYRFVRGGPYYSRIQDEEQNNLYYPTIDNLGLLPPET